MSTDSTVNYLDPRGGAKIACRQDIYIRRYMLECSWHEGKFDIRSGQPCSLPCTEPLRTLPVGIADGEVFIEV